MALRRIALLALASTASADVLGGLKDRLTKEVKEVGKGLESAKEALAECKEDAKKCRQRAKESLANTTGFKDLSEAAQNMKVREAEQSAGLSEAAEKFSECFDAKKDQKQMKACRAAADSALDSSLMRFVPENATKELKDRLVKQMKRSAEESSLGNVITDCLKSKKARDTCTGELKEKLAAAGMAEENPLNILSRALQGRLTDALKNCSADDAAACRRRAKELAKESGMEPHEFAAVQQLGERKACAEVFARCRDEGEDEESCLNMTRTEFLKLSGARLQDFDDELERSVKSLGEAIRTGVRLVMVRKKALLVQALTSGSACDPALEDWFTNRSLVKVAANGSRAERAMKKACRLADGAAMYRCAVDVNASAEELASLGAAVAASYQGESIGRRLLEEGLARRLAETVTEAYASQEVVECPESDSSCTGEAAEATTTMAPTPTPAPTAQGTVSGAWHAAPLAAAAFWLALAA